MNRFIGLILLSFMFFPVAVRAQCTNPPAEMGVLIMNKAHKVMQYCNGDDWVGLWGGGGGSGGGQRISGEIAAFDLTACPDGWSPYAPSSGRFLRGRCITGQSCNDPDGLRTVGSVQADGFKQHGHTNRYTSSTSYNGYGQGGNAWHSNFTTAYRDATTNIEHIVNSLDPTAGPETRPRNVAVLYCRKD